MRRRYWGGIVTVSLVGLASWTSGAKADKISLCFAFERFICANNNNGGDKFVKTTQLEVLGIVFDSSALKAANEFRKPGKAIRSFPARASAEFIKRSNSTAVREVAPGGRRSRDKYVHGPRQIKKNFG